MFVMIVWLCACMYMYGYEKRHDEQGLDCC